MSLNFELNKKNIKIIFDFVQIVLHKGTPTSIPILVVTVVDLTHKPTQQQNLDP